MYMKDELFKVLLKYNFDNCRGEIHVSEYLHSHYNEYITEIKNAISLENPLLGSSFCEKLNSKVCVIEKICKEIVDILVLYIDGKIKLSYEKSYELFNSISQYFITTSYGEHSNEFYRIRSGNFSTDSSKNKKEQKAELFHIKDKYRNKINAYRYSIAGYPALYLSTGFELAWFECGMPRKFSYCKMQIKKGEENIFKLIDFSNRPFDLLDSTFRWIINAKGDKNELGKIHDYLLKYIITYPLALACSLKVHDRLEKFIQEYIMPQILMQWVRDSNKYYGIKYKSSLNTTLVKNMCAFNVVLPVKKFRKDGLCSELTSKLLVSDIAYLDINREFEKYKDKLYKLDNFKNELQSKTMCEKFYKFYQLDLIHICEYISIIYKSLISGQYANLELLLYQINCLSDYIHRIEKSRDCIVKETLNNAKYLFANIEDSEIIKEEIEEDLKEFNQITINIVKPNIVFSFTKENIEGFEEI